MSRTGLSSVVTLSNLAILTLALGACNGPPTEPVEASLPPSDSVTSVVVFPQEVELTAGDQVQFGARLIDDTGLEIPDPDLEWTATGGSVSPDGRFTAGDEIGEFHVEARPRGNGQGGGPSGKASVRVKDGGDGPDGDPNQAPAASFEFQCDGLACEFDASGSEDVEGPIATFAWEFGDGTEGTGTNPSHGYGASGTYTVSLTVVDEGGASSTVVNSVQVQEPDPPPDDPPGDPLDETIYPGEDIQAAVDANPTGTTFLIKAGVHRMQSVRPKSGNEFVGEAGAILAGARLLTAFEREGSLWVATNQTQENPNHTGTCYDGTGNEGAKYGPAPRCNYPEDLFIDDQPLWHVSSKSDVGPGTFYFDYVADRIYFWDDPTGRKVEASVTESAFNGEHGPSGVTIRALIVEKYANPGQRGAIRFPNANDWLVTDSEVRYNHGVGIDLSTNSRARILGNSIHHNGQLGLGAFKSVDLLLEGNDIAYNGRVGYRDAWEAGAMKIVASRGTVIRNNYSHHNFGKGFWLDYDNTDFVIEANTAEYNDAHGVFSEANCNGVVRNNVLRYNGTYGVIIDSSHDIEVVGNEAVGNGDFWPEGHAWRHPYQLGARISPHAGKVEANCGVLELVNVEFRDNDVTNDQDLGASEMAASGGAVFDANTYRLSGSALAPFRLNGTARTVEQWKDAGYDVNSSFQP